MVAGILVVNAILSFVHIRTCGAEVGAPPCPDSVNLAAGEMVGGLLLVVVGAIMTVGVGVLVFLVCGGIYAFVRALAGSSGLISVEGFVAAAFVALLVLLVIIGSIVGRAGGAQRDTTAQFKDRAVRTDGVIAAVTDTGWSSNNNPRVELTIEYRRADNTTAQVRQKLWVSRLNIPRPGDPIAVWYDPDGQDAIAEFDASTPVGVADAVRAGVADAEPDFVLALERLAMLHRDGALDADEFARAKDRLLQGYRS